MATNAKPPAKPKQVERVATNLPAPRKVAAKLPNKQATPPVVAPKAAKASKAVKAEKSRKVNMVRDSFTMPENDYAQLAELKKKCLQAGVHVKKSELLRAGLKLLSGLPGAALLKAVEQVEKIKTGRPAKR
jgi:hypothetical protein